MNPTLAYICVELAVEVVGTLFLTPLVYPASPGGVLLLLPGAPAPPMLAYSVVRGEVVVVEGGWGLISAYHPASSSGIMQWTRG